MKVYFEKTGSNNNENFITVYIKPLKNGSGHRYTSEGNISEFSHVHPNRALCIDHKFLPKNYWFAFKHGENTWKLECKYDFTIENILSHIQIPIRTFRQVYAEKLLQNRTLNTEQDIINNLTLITKCKYIPNTTARQILKIMKDCSTPIINGESGISALLTSIKISSYIHSLQNKYK